MKWNMPYSWDYCRFGLWHDAMQGDDCSYRHGFLMAFTPWYTTNSSSFSKCSLNDFQKEIEYVGISILPNHFDAQRERFFFLIFLFDKTVCVCRSKKKYECMYQPPNDKTKNLPQLMPGRVKNLRDQCESVDLGLPCNVRSFPFSIFY